MSTSYVIAAPPQASIPVAGESKSFPVRRIWCVGRNYLEHIREMGNDERAPPFFFAKHPDMIEPDGATIPYPPLTKDLHHEVELIVALKSGGLNISLDKALHHIYGYGVGIDLTRRDLQLIIRVHPAELRGQPVHLGVTIGWRCRAGADREQRHGEQKADTTALVDAHQPIVPTRPREGIQGTPRLLSAYCREGM